MAKNRDAPIKHITLPKLELMGRVKGARLAKHVTDNLLRINKTVFWCDSQILLSKIKSTKQQKQFFFYNRVMEIKELCDESHKRYCPTVGNPADLLTCGISSEDFTNNTI